MKTWGQEHRTRYPAERHLKVETGHDVCPELIAQMTSSITLICEPECLTSPMPRRYQIIDFLRALTLASYGSGYGAACESDIRIRYGIGGRFRGRARTVAGPAGSYC